MSTLPDGTDAPEGGLGETLILSDGADLLTGGAGDDIFDLTGSIRQLDALVDSLDGGGGTDVLRAGGGDRTLGLNRLGALHRVEVLDLTQAGGALAVAVNAGIASQSDTGTFTIRFGDNAMALNTGGVISAHQIVADGPGVITLAAGTPGQMLTLGDSAGGTVITGRTATVIHGGAMGDRVTGGDGNDIFLGNGGNDTLSGGRGNDSLSGGDGGDVLSGGDGNDLLAGGPGADRLAGGAGHDQYIIGADAQGTVIADYDSRSLVERIDLQQLAGLRGLADLTLAGQGADLRVTGAGLDIVIRNVQASDLDGSDFLFAGQDPLVFNVRAGTTNAQLQQLLDNAPPHAVINIAAGTYVITEALRISRSDITIRGAGEGKTVFLTRIGSDDAAPTILVQPEDLQDSHGKLPSGLAEGSNRVLLPGTGDFKVGDLIFLSQENDDAYLRASGDLDNPDGKPDWVEPPGNSELHYLREFRSRIVSIENGVATLAEGSPYSFAAGLANVAKSTFLENVTLSDFTIRGDFSAQAGGSPDPDLFKDMLPGWGSVAALELDGVRDSALSRITLIDPAAHGFKWQRAHETTADSLTAIGAYNKDGSSGYHFLLQESFANDFTNLSSTDARHAVLFSAYNAEHYNSLHLLYANRDINFHGSADDGNAIVVDVLDQSYPQGSSPQWQAVHPGVRGLHPLSDIEGNDVTFRYARSGDRADRIVAHADGGDIAMRGGSDLGIGQGGNDRFDGGIDNDTLQGGGGNDNLLGGSGKDVLIGGTGRDILRGGDGNDLLQGGDGDDLIDGGAGGDDLYGGAGRDTFLRRFADLTDTIHDFQAGAGGDVLLIQGTAYNAFSQIELRQAGADVIVDFGPSGYTLLKNIRLNVLTAANFAFAADAAAGQDIRLKATQMHAVGTNKDDVFAASRAHVDDDSFTVLGGAGFDEIRILQSSLYANLGKVGAFSGIEGFDLSAIPALSLVVENALVSQADDDRLFLSVGGASAGKTVRLDVGPLARGNEVFIDGARQVQLAGGRDHVVKAGDGAGVDIIGDTLRDTIQGGRGNDMIRGNSGNDILSGGSGGDTLCGDRGNDTLEGGAGSDLLIVDSPGDKVIEKSGWAGTDTVRASVDFRMGGAHVENLELTGTAGLGVGNDLRNRIIGNTANNVLDGGKGIDTLAGGAGNDTYLLRTPGDTVIEKAGGGIDTVKAFYSATLGAHVERLYIQTVLDRAGKGVEGIKATGNALDNLLVGNPFDNTLAGGGGKDTLQGGAGADTFVFDRAPGAGNVDRILDFDANEAREGDILMMKRSVFAGLDKGRLDQDHFHLGTAAQDADDRFIFDRASGRLWFDADGTGADGQDLVATFADGARVAAHDILLF